MPGYREAIIEDTGCNPDDAVMIEYIMRDHIFHSTLDWQNRAQLRRAARQAVKILAEDRPLFEEHFARTRAMFEEGKRSAESTKS